MNVLSQIEGGAKRLSEIVRVLTKYGIAGWLSDVKIDWIANALTSEHGERLTHRSTEERIRLALTELGTTTIKLGQMLSTRPDLVGVDLAQELTKLQSSTPPDKSNDVMETLQSELGASVNEAFTSFDTEPIASASIGQVHQAVLSTGERVAVKVMHKDIEERVHRDLDLLAFLADLMEKHSPVLRQYRPVATVRHFRQTLLRELDYSYERRHLEEFAKNFRRDPTVHFPAVFPEWSTRRVLTMELLDGVPVSDREAMEATGADLTEYARRGATMYLEMIFRDGFYHADPHPGNLFLLANNTVGVVDCGMVGRIDETLRSDIESILLASALPDADEIVEIICRMGLVPAELDTRELKRDLSEILADYTSQPIDQFDLAGALNRVTDLIRSYHIILPQGFAMFFKTLIMLEGTAQQVSPSFSLTELLTPYYKKAARRRLSPKRLVYETARSYRDWHRMLNALPRDLTDIISRARHGSFEIHHEHRRLEGTVDRLVKGILTSALFMGSSMMLSSEVPPVIKGVSILGALGILASLVLAIPLLITIRKSTKNRD